MTNHVAQLFEKRGVPVVVACLYRLSGQSVEMVVRDELFQKHVLEPCWAQLSVPLRLIGQPRLRWEEFFGAIRRQAFEVQQGRLALRKDIHAFLSALIGKLFEKLSAPDSASAKPLRPAASAGAPPSAPLRASAKPAAKTAPTDPSLAVGIDLGTTYSVIAYIDSAGRPTSIPNSAGELLTPSVVLFDPSGPIVGKEAVLAAAMEPDRVVECVKRDMGQKAFHRPINGEEVPPEVISSFILRSLKADVERKFGGPVTQAVITVPAYFDETRRRATMDAGRLAGLDVLDIINEPTAAAIAYGYQLNFLDPKTGFHRGRPLRVLVFDLGGGTFDVTIVQIEGRHFKALATDGDVYLGGKDWDARLIDIACDRFITTHHQDPRTHPASLQELSFAAEVAKKTLSERPRAKLVVNHLGTRLMIEISREEFEEKTAALVTRTRNTTEIVLRQAGLTWQDIDQILLVGGATRMPMIERMLTELSGKAPSHAIAVDEAVAHGAALYAELVQRQRANQPANFSVTNVNSHSLGIIGTDPNTGSRRCRVLIPKNTPLPHAVSRYFRTLRRSQRSVAVRVVEGESEEPEHCTTVGTCAITDLPPNLPQGSSVLVQYAYQANGRLRVTAKLKGHPVGVTTEFQRNNSLPDDAVQLWTEYVAMESQQA